MTEIDNSRSELGVYDIGDPQKLGIDNPMAEARRLLQFFGERLLVADPKKGSAVVFTIDDRSGTWNEAYDPQERRPSARFVQWNAEVVAAYRDAIQKAFGEKKLVFSPSSVEENAKLLGRALAQLEKRGDAVGAKRVQENLPALLLHLQDEGKDLFGATMCDLSEIDGDRRYIGYPNGVFDLREGKLLPPAEGRKALVATRKPYDFDQDATHPDVDRLLSHMPEAKREWLLDNLAYSLHGKPNRRVNVMVGPTKGGKSTLMSAIKNSMGEYAKPLGVGSLAPKRGSGGANQATPDMAAVMQPTRIAYIQEAEQLHIDSARIKSLVGGDSQSYRMLYENNREGVPTAAIFLLGNDHPESGYGSVGDPAMRDRLAVMEYPPIPADSRDERMLNAFNLNEDGAEQRCQALDALLVSRAAGMDSDSAPKPPPEIVADTESLFHDEMGLDGAWLRDHIKRTGNKADKLLGSELWERVSRAVGENDPAINNGQWSDGTTREQITLKAQAVCGIGKPKTIRKDSARGRGWVGWVILPDGMVPDDEPGAEDGTASFFSAPKKGS